MSALRILQIAHDHPEWTAGGTEFAARDLAYALGRRKGVRSNLLVASTSLQRPEGRPGALGAIGSDLAIHTGTYDRFSMTRLDGTDWIESVRRVITDLRPHVVHLHGLDRLGAEIIPLLRRLAPRTRLVLTLHDYQLICPNDGLFLRVPDGTRCDKSAPDRCRSCFPAETAARHALRRAHLLALLHEVDLFLAPSRFLRARFVEWGLAPERIVVVPGAVRMGQREVAGRPRRRDRFAFFGTLAEHKGVLTLLDAAARLRRLGAQIDIALNGGLRRGDPDFAATFATSLEAASPVARHAGSYARAELPRLMAAADWVVVPSLWWENAPMVIFEAQASGRPVICSGIGGMAELVRDGVDGLHVPPGDPVALARLMQEVTEDPDLWDRLSSAARPSDHEVAVSRHLELYARIARKVSA